MRLLIGCLSLALTGCATGPMTQEERDNADRTIKALQILQAGPWGAKPAAAPAPSFGNLLYQSAIGTTRYCTYDKGGQKVTLMQQNLAPCPTSF